jgi:threonine aldolase
MSFVWGAKRHGGWRGGCFFDRELASEFEYRCKQAGQLASKMRFISPLDRDAGWWCLAQNARHANSCAALLEQKLSEISSVKIMYPRQANSVLLKCRRRLSLDYALQAGTSIHSSAPAEHGSCVRGRRPGRMYSACRGGQESICGI